MAADHREKWTLSEGDRIQCADAVYIITGSPIGYGGSSIVYPARRTDTQLKLVIKECFPKEGTFHRPNGTIVPLNADDRDAAQRLRTLTGGMQREQYIGQNIHNSGDRAVCIRELLRPQSIFTRGRTCPGNDGCFAILDRLDPNTISLDDLLVRIANAYTPEERLRTEGLPDIHTTACIIEEVLCALEQVHTATDLDRPQVHGYYFGDLHGSNIYFSGSRLSAGDVGHARPIDFGSAHELDQHGFTQELKMQDLFSATGIRPPEINQRGLFRLTRGADLFSVGCLMARCVMTQVQLDSYHNLLCTGPTPLFSEDCERINCPPELLPLVNHILDLSTAETPARRYQNVPAMLADIRKLKEKSTPLRNQLGLGLSTLPADAFVGRSRERQALDRAMREQCNPIILYGFPGIGKTELAIDYGRRKSLHSRVYFVRFTGSFLETITGPIADAFSGYSKVLPGGIPKSRAQICREVLRLLSQCSQDDILIIDHVDCPSGNFLDLQTSEFHRLCALPMHLLLTTRCDPDGFGHWEQIGPLEPWQLCQIMERHVSFSRERLEPLIEAVGRHTLMVDLMARTMQESLETLTPENLLRSLSGSAAGDLPEIGTTHDRSPRHAQLHTHLRTLFDLSGMHTDEITVLCCAVLLPDNGMDAALFRLALTEDASRGRLERSAMLHLTKTGWLTVTKGSMLSIHPVVREICRKDLIPDAAHCGAFLDRLWNWYEKSDYRADQYTQIAHCLAASMMLPGLRDPYRASHTGMLYQRLGLYAKAQEYAALALEIALKVLPQESPELARFYGNLGAVCGALRDFDHQQEYCQRELSILQMTDSVNRLELAACYSALGTCYGSREAYALELEYQQKALNIRRELLPPDHPDLADSYSRVGGAMCHTKDLSEGLKLQEKALQIREQILPPDHLDLASSHINLASACYLLRRKRDSLDHLWKALHIRQAKLPKNHPDLAQVHHNLGLIYHSLGNLRSSLEHYLRCLQIRREILSTGDPMLLQACINVVEASHLLGEHETELEYRLQLLELQLGLLPEDHPDMIQPYRSIARLYAGLKRPHQQIVYLHKAARCGDLDSMRQLGTALLLNEQYQDGLHWLDQAVRRKDIHATYIMGRLRLGSNALPRDLKQAIPMLEQAAQRNHPMANQVLGQLFLSRSPDAPFDPRRALDHLLTARNLGAHVDDALIREAQDLLRR